MMITVGHEDNGLNLSYEAILGRAGYAPDRVLTVVYDLRSGDTRRSGELAPGEFLRVETGMRISVTDTSNA